VKGKTLTAEQLRGCVGVIKELPLADRLGKIIGGELDGVSVWFDKKKKCWQLVGKKGVRLV